LTTMWVMLGEPAFTLAVPCWPSTDDVAAPLRGEKTSSVCDIVRSLRDSFYEELPGAEGKKVALLQATVLPRIWAQTLPCEQRHVQEVATALEQWRKTGFDAGEARVLHQRISNESLKQLIHLKENLVLPAAAGTQ